jgi:predicted nucleic-acid-binding protein
LIAIDTNILVRLLVEDDAGRAAAVRRLLTQAAEREEKVLLTTPVICELDWVLDAAYGARRGDVATAIDRLLDDPAFEIGEREAVSEALLNYRQTSADLSDCLIAALARRSGARVTMTFDRRMRRVPGCSVLTATRSAER